MYTLQSFGIPTMNFPIDTATGERVLTNHKKWMEWSLAKEANDGVGAALRKRIIECPLHSDILFGRGHIVMKHPGNTMFRNVIKAKLGEYISIKSKKESTKLTWEIVRILKSKYGARFLKEELLETNGLCWVETTNEIARCKVRIAFRDARTRRIRTAGKQEILDETNTNSSIASSTKRNADGDSKGNDINVPPSSRTTTLPYLTDQQQQLFTSPIINFCNSNSNNNNLNSNDGGFGTFFDIANNSASMLPQQVADSSTSVFLGMGSGGGGVSKRQRTRSQNFCSDGNGFNCF